MLIQSPKGWLTLFFGVAPTTFLGLGTLSHRNKFAGFGPPTPRLCREAFNGIEALASISFLVDYCSERLSSIELSRSCALKFRRKGYCRHVGLAKSRVWDPSFQKSRVGPSSTFVCIFWLALPAPSMTPAASGPSHGPQSSPSVALFGLKSVLQRLTVWRHSCAASPGSPMHWMHWMHRYWRQCSCDWAMPVGPATGRSGKWQTWQLLYKRSENTFLSTMFG